MEIVLQPWESSTRKLGRIETLTRVKMKWLALGGSMTVGGLSVCVDRLVPQFTIHLQAVK